MSEEKAAQFRQEIRAGDGKPEGTIESLGRCVRMLDAYAPEFFPANDNGQVHFVRAMVESVADEILQFIANHKGYDDIKKERDDLLSQVNALIESCYYRTKKGKIHWCQGSHYGTSTADDTDPAAFEQAIAAIRWNAGIDEAMNTDD